MGLWLLPGVVGLAALLGLGAFAWLRTEAGNDWLLGKVLPLVQPAAGAIEVGRLRTDLLGHLSLQDVVVRSPAGVELIRVATAEADYDGQSLIGRALPVRRLEVRGVVVALDEPGVFSTMWPSDPESPPWGGLPIDLAIDAAHLEGDVGVAGQRVDGLALDLALSVRGRQVRWAGLVATGTTAVGPARLTSTGAWSPARTVVEALRLELGEGPAQSLALSGALDGDKLAFHVDPLHVELPALAPLVPALADVPLRAPIDATGAIRGTLATPEVEVTLGTAGGPITLGGAVALGDRAWRLAVDTPGLDVEAVVAGLEPVRVAGRAEASGVGWTWPDGLDAAGRVDATVAVRGERVRLEGGVRAGGGKVELDDLDADAGWAAVRASGEVDVVGKVAHVRVERSRGELGRVGVAGGATFAGAVDAGWAEGVRVRVAGDVTATGLGAQGATVAAAEGPVEVVWADGALSGGVDLLVRDVAWKDRRAAVGTLHVELGPTVAARLALEEPDREVALVDARYGLEDRRVRVDALRVELAPGVVLEARGAQAARLVEGGVAEAAVDLAVGVGRLRVTGGASTAAPDTLVVRAEGLDLAELARVVGPAIEGWAGRVDLEATSTGTLEAPGLAGEVRVAGLRVPGAVEGLAGRLELDGDGRRLTLAGELGSATAEVARWRADLPVRLGAAGVAVDPAGAVSASVAVVPVDLAGLRPLFAGAALPEARVSAGLEVTGTLAEPGAHLVASADVPLGSGGPSVRTWAEARLGGDVVTARVVLNQAFVSRLETTLASRVDVPALRAWAEGRAPKPDPEALFRDFGGAVVFKQLPLATVRHFARLDADVDGALAGAFALDGNPLSPRVQGGVTLVDARVGSLAVSPATLELRPLGLGYMVSAKLGFAVIAREAVRAGVFAEAPPEAPPTCASAASDPAGALEVTGVVPLDTEFDLERRGLSLTIGGAGVPLAAVEAFVPGMAGTGGCFHLGGTVTGSLADPRLDVGVALTRGITTLAPVGVRLEDIDVSGRVQGDRVVFDHVRARTRAGGLRLDGGAGGLEGSGVLELAHWLPTTLTASLALDRAWLVATADQRAQVSGKVDVVGKGKTLDVTGQVTVDSGYLRLPERFFADSAGSELHPDIEVVRPGAAVEAVKAGEAAPFPFTVRPRVKVDLARHVRLQAAMPLQGAYGDLARSLTTVTVETDVDGVLDVSSKGGRLRLAGEVTTDRGQASLLGRPFDLANGVVAFTGADVSAPILNLRAVHHTSGCGDIVAQIGGVPGSPQIDFSTEGEGLAGDDDILQTLILGSCPGSSDNPGEDALGQTLALVTQMLQKEVQGYGSASGEAIHLEKLELDEAGAGRVGVALGRNVLLTTEFDGAAQADENSLTIRVEVALPYKWYLSVDSGDRGVSSLALRRKWRLCDPGDPSGVCW